MEASFYSDCNRLVVSIFREVKQQRSQLLSLWVTACDFMDDSANATFGGRVGMGGDIPLSPDPGVQGKVSLIVIHRLRRQVFCVQLMSFG